MNQALPPIQPTIKTSTQGLPTRDQEISKADQSNESHTNMPHKKPAYNMLKSRMIMSHQGLVIGSNI